MTIVKSVLSPDPLYLDPKTYDAKSDRKVIQDLRSQGCPGAPASTNFKVSLTSGLGISIAAGMAYIQGTNVADQGMYRQYIASPVAMTVPTADPTNPRLDQVICRVCDNAADAGTFNEGRFEIVTGTPTAGATLINRNGAANLATLPDNSKSLILLADILVPAGASSLTGANLADRRIPSVSAFQSGDYGLLSARPSIASYLLSSGYTYFATDDHGGTLYDVQGGSWVAVTPGLKWHGGDIQYSFTLAAGTTQVLTSGANSGTKVVVFNNGGGAGGVNNGFPALPSLTTTFTAQETGIYQYSAEHSTLTAGNMGIAIIKNGLTKIDGDNKAVLLGFTSDTYKSDVCSCDGLVSLTTGDTLDLYAFHSAGSTDTFEFSVIKMPL